MSSTKASLALGIVAGALGGLLAAWAMRTLRANRARHDRHEVDSFDDDNLDWSLM